VTDRPIIVVSVGTDHHPFNRVIEWVDRWQDGRNDVECFFQIGTSAPPTSASPWEQYLGYEELVALMTSATAIVCHGGPATIMDARAAGVRPIVVPRTAARYEHVDDHQVLFTRRLAELGEVDLADTETALTTALELAVSEPGRYRLDGGENNIDEAVAAFGSIARTLMHRHARRSRRRPAPLTIGEVTS
jgi:UDP-N-acetylglucosamine transferase subunit ALG13